MIVSLTPGRAGFSSVGHSKTIHTILKIAEVDGLVPSTFAKAWSCFCVAPFSHVFFVVVIFSPKDAETTIRYVFQIGTTCVSNLHKMAQ